MTIDENNAFLRVQLARHPARPYPLDLLPAVFDEWLEIAGDRRYANDPALICGLARLGEHELMVIGQQKGRDTKQRRHRNFGMPKPEGYRKALRAMQLAEKFGRGIITFIDTPGAYPGIDAEERGQAEAIAVNLRQMANLRVPIIVVILGEGGSGGALAIGVGDRVLMFENSIYSVISPEGCASILWKDSALAARAAASLHLTAPELLALGVIDAIIPEPPDWNVNADSTNTNSTAGFDGLKSQLIKSYAELTAVPVPDLLRARWQRWRRLGQWHE